MKLDLKSLRTRFILATVLWISSGLLITGILVSTLVRNYVVQGFHEEMEIHIEELAALTSIDESGQPFLIRRLSDPRFIPSKSGYYWQVNREGFQTIRSPSLGNANLIPTLAIGTKSEWQIVRGANGDMLEYGMLRFPQKDKAPLQLLIATDKEQMDMVLMQIDWPLLYSLSGFALIMVILGGFQINYSLRPLQRMKNAIADVQLGRSARLGGQYPTEIEPLVADLNLLLDANTEMVQSARVQAGNLAHGLRTPLAVMMDEAHLIDQRGDKKSAEIFLQCCQQMQRYIDFYTTRARMAAVARLPGQRSSIEQTLRPVLIAMKRLYAHREITICMGQFPDVSVSVEPVDLEEMTSNLIDNACKWAKSKVIISWEVTAQHATIFIDDDGIGIDHGYLEKVLEVGERLDRSEMGTGLGLSIVRDLVLHYRGHITLGGSPLGGLRAELNIPLAKEKAGQ